ncbi:hypothetical protein E1292_03310 [Nonomuraea deserti]|uniref:Copper resistance protein D domain-containing protein n=1 Tax=Nonomuraea deserti TaxID=1848322 RepID=A0A4R4WEI0_9ACTN|nr:hypothetical protein [Nonomuraea deserti]TDD11870.1 hypothetical protein E1292_03310 [Nonomuraea deserti]
MTWWSAVRFLHVLSAALWVGGQLTVSLVLLPVVRRSMDAQRRREVLNAVGRRFGLFTAAVLLPVQVVTGVAIAGHKGVTWASLADPGYGRILAAKLLLFCAVMAAAALHGVASAKGRPAPARAMAMASLAGSLGVILLATALPVT